MLLRILNRVRTPSILVNKPCCAIIRFFLRSKAFICVITHFVCVAASDLALLRVFHMIMSNMNLLGFRRFKSKRFVTKYDHNTCFTKVV